LSIKNKTVKKVYFMAEIIITGPAGRLEGRYHQSGDGAPVALVLHPHPMQGGTMNNKVSYVMYQTFVKLGFNVMRFNFRGVGKSEGAFDDGNGELSDAATMLDWLQAENPHAKGFWIAGFSFGAWISMQLLMRRPELSGFISTSPPANMYDFNFLAPCPVSGLLIQGDTDDVVPLEAVEALTKKLRQQKGIQIDLDIVKGADHFFTGKLPILSQSIEKYLVKRGAITPR
jgi:alpha/beta superfamily hydrolase